MSYVGNFTAGLPTSVGTVTGNAGGAVSPTAGNINIVGSGSVTVTGNPATSTLTISTSSGLTWSIISADQAIAINNGYICNKAGLLSLSLPAVSAVGSVFRVSGMNTDIGWRITQGAGQQIHFGSADTSAGAAGSLTSTLKRDSVELICVVANSEWNVVSSVGNITIA